PGPPPRPRGDVSEGARPRPARRAPRPTADRHLRRSGGSVLQPTRGEGEPQLEAGTLPDRPPPAAEVGRLGPELDHPFARQGADARGDRSGDGEPNPGGGFGDLLVGDPRGGRRGDG